MTRESSPRFSRNKTWISQLCFPLVAFVCVRRKASKQDKKENVLITEMARRVRDWGIDKPQNAQNCVWTWGFKYKNPPKCTGGFQNHALRFAWSTIWELRPSSSARTIRPRRWQHTYSTRTQKSTNRCGRWSKRARPKYSPAGRVLASGPRKRSAGCTRSCRRCEVINEHPIQWCRVTPCP